MWNLFKVNNKDARTMYQICTKLNIETLDKMWSLLKVGNKGNRKISETIQCINRTVTQYEKAVQSQQ